MNGLEPSAAGTATDPLSDEAVGAWVERQLETLNELQRLAHKMIVAMVAQIERGGDLARLGRGVTQLTKAVRLCVALGWRLAQTALDRRRGVVEPPAPAKEAGSAAAPVTAGDAAKAMVTAVPAVKSPVTQRVAALFDRLGPEEFGDELRGRSNAEVYRTICGLMGVTPDPVLFGPAGVGEPVAAVEPVAESRPAAPVADDASLFRPANRWERRRWRARLKAGRGPPDG